MGIFEENRDYERLCHRLNPTAQRLVWQINAREKEIEGIDKKLKNYELNGQKNPPPQGKAEILRDRKVVLVQRNTRDRAVLDSFSKSR